ncbi:unnamed protein product, partial [Iphiclides podalirius]
MTLVIVVVTQAKPRATACPRNSLTYDRTRAPALRFGGLRPPRQARSLSTFSGECAAPIPPPPPLNPYALALERSLHPNVVL